MAELTQNRQKEQPGNFLVPSISGPRQNRNFLNLQAHMKKRQLFLKWCLTNMLTMAIIFLAAAFGATQTPNLSLVGKMMVLAILVIYFITTIYGGLLSWRTDKVLDEIKGAGDGQASGLHQQLADLNHKADHISFAANECPYIGLLGAITGIYFFMTGSAGLGGVLDSSHIKEIMSNSLAGLGIAFIPTITGVFFRSVLSWQHHLIAHEVTYVLKGY
jgi:MotA/TolQ/ExbB proton channel family protein